jgi:hypothetical protein
MTSGSRLEMVGSPSLIGGFHSVRACSRVFLVMRWTMLEKVSGSLPCGTGFASLLSFCGGQYGRATLSPTLTWDLRLFR